MHPEWVDVVVGRIRRLTVDRAVPLLVAIDGRSGAGKSTLAAAVAGLIGAAVIDGDDFYAGGSASQWDAMTPADRAAHCIDWRRQRPVLETLLRGEAASWRPYDWEADDGRLARDPQVLDPTPVVLLEGAYSARPELADLYGLTVLLEVPAHIRQERVRRREGHDYRAAWEARWASAEEHYFGTVRPSEAFDLVLRGPGGHAPA